MRSIRNLFLLLTLLPSCCSISSGQVKLSSEPVLIVDGLKNWRQVGSHIVVDEGSKPSQASAALVRMTFEKPDIAKLIFVDVERIPDLEIIDPEMIDSSSILIAQRGRFRVTALIRQGEDIFRNRITVEVKDSGGGPVDPPPVDPPPVVGDWADLKKFSGAQAALINDPETAKRLQAALRSVQPQLIGAPDKTTAMVFAVQTIENALAARRGESLSKDWLGLWRRPLNVKLSEAAAAGRMPTQKDYAAAMAAAADGLFP